MNNKNWVLECKDIERIWKIKASGERNDKLYIEYHGPE
jgi:hypothetical protein